jgi:uncharacterized protein YjiS (DUF1127 family)
MAIVWVGKVRSLHTHGAGASAAVVRALIRLWKWQVETRRRRPLSSLNRRELNDIGVSRATTAGEGNRAFWRARMDLHGGF